MGTSAEPLVYIENIREEHARLISEITEISALWKRAYASGHHITAIDPYFHSFIIAISSVLKNGIEPCLSNNDDDVVAALQGCTAHVLEIAHAYQSAGFWENWLSRCLVNKCLQGCLKEFSTNSILIKSLYRVGSFIHEPLLMKELFTCLDDVGMCLNKREHPSSDLEDNTSDSNQPTSSRFSLTSPVGANFNTENSIVVINCDNIPIWTDDMSHSAYESHVNSNDSTKSTRSFNHFVSNLFCLMPTYTDWAPSYVNVCSDRDEARNTAGSQADSFFDAFATVNAGTKLKKANSPVLKHSFHSLDGGYRAATSKAKPVSHRRSKNQDELQKENAHFHIAELCMSAAERIKWNSRSCASPNRHILKRISVEQTLASIDCHEGKSAHSLTAEAIGLRLLTKYNEEQLPSVQELKWLMNDDCIKRKLLPFPLRYSRSSTDYVLPYRTTRVKNWTPPQPQLILEERQKFDAKNQKDLQKFRCPGCDVKLNQCSQNFRYCNYMGKFYCPMCHRNQMSIIPAKVLKNWNFDYMEVSVLVYHFLEQIFHVPIFHVPDINKNLYSIPALAEARRKREKLSFAKNFIESCRFANELQNYFRNIPAHITADPELWSMCDLVDVHKASMVRSIDEIFNFCNAHIQNCDLCKGRGFTCEICKNNDVIYLWYSDVQRCSNCGSCFHVACWRPEQGPCARCKRITSFKSKHV